MITKSTSPGYLYAVTTDSTCLITDIDTRYNLCKAAANKQGMFVAIGGSVECSDDNVILTQASSTSGGTRFEVVTTRPEIGEVGVIYLVPSSSSATENLYEEWLWVDDKWEQIGSAGLNLSNYAQLTTANTFSADNTFNGNLIKKSSTTVLAANSVLNRSEMDNRYGTLSGSNTWSGPCTTFLHDVNMKGSVSIVGHLGMVGKLSAGSEKDTISVVANLNMGGKNIVAVSRISSPRGAGLGIESNIHAYGNSIYEVDELALATLKASSLSATSDVINVTSSLHFPTGNGSYIDPDVVIANAELRAVDLSTILDAPDKYGIRITNTSCQLFGIDFNYGDVWSETNDRLKAQGATPMPGLDSASYLDTVKIRKPAVSIETTGIGSLSFDYANEAYIRTFPNDGGQGIFEFQAGNWETDARTSIKRGPVDLRKASATTLGPTSVLNMEEGDARWSTVKDVLVGSVIPPGSSVAQSELRLDAAYSDGISFGIAIGPAITANLYRDIAIGGNLSTSMGNGCNTLLGYGLEVMPNTTDAIAIGHNNYSSMTIKKQSIIIGNNREVNGEYVIAINGDVFGDKGISLNGAAGDRAIAIGASSNAVESSVAIGVEAGAGLNGTALGTYSVAGENELVLQAGSVPAVSMQLYSGESWENRNTTGYLRFVTARLPTGISTPSASDREEITIHKKPLWDAIQRAKDYNYPAQPLVNLTGGMSDVPLLLSNMKPNTIYHILTGDVNIGIESMAFDSSIPGIASAELHFDIPSGITPIITWPDIMIWPGEADPTVPPTLTGSDTVNKLYAIVVRKQVTTTGEFLVASVAYSFEY